jgi:hypothetical protein
MPRFTTEGAAKAIREFVSSNIENVPENHISTFGDVDETIEVEFGANNAKKAHISTQTYIDLTEGYTGETGVRVACVGFDLSKGVLYFKVMNL